jgi:hypothetical protein
MAKAAQTVLATDEITFELERFELVDGQLEVTGRWFGVRGRRFVRPTLTPLSGRDLSRVLADLEHKPWAPEDGGEWLAAFPWARNGVSVKFELSVAPDIVIRLPSPRAKLTLPRRIAALPRPSIAGPAWPQPQVDQAEEPAAGPAAAGAAGAGATEAEGPTVPTLAEAEAEVEPIRDPQAEFALELERTRAEHELQLQQARAELESARAALDAAAAARDAAAGETAAARDAVIAEAAGAAAIRDELAALQSAHAELEAAYDELASERDRLTTDLAAGERALAELRSELERSAAAVQEAARERDQVISSHGAAMVMRRAARGTPSHAREHTAWREAAAVVALIAAVFVILIVIHVL